MRTRLLAPLAGTLAFGLWIGVCVAQVPSGTKSFDPTITNTDAAITAATEAARAAAAVKNWTPPRTAWGDPDLQGYYLNLSYTPLERPADVGKPFYTEQEAIAAFRKAVQEDAEVDPRVVHYDWKEYGMDAWQSPVRPNLRTSLIVDPPDGKLPPMTAEGRRRAADARAETTNVATRGLYERCVTGNQGPPRVPLNHDSESQIVQTPGYVVLVLQSNNDIRIIPLDGRPHLPSRVGTWLGDSRGHWEGNTLVIDTTNFNADRNWRGSTSGMHLVERLTRVDPNTVKYEFTATDPTTWTRSWSVEYPWPRIAPGLYEFACHEQNYGLINVVKGAQIRAREAAAKGGQPARETPEAER